MPQSNAASAAPVQQPQASESTSDATSHTADGTLASHDQGTKRDRHSDEHEASGREQQHKFRRTAEEYGELLSVMRNEGVLLELSGPMRTTNDKVDSIRTIKSSRSCVAFGLCHVESLGRHGVCASHEGKLKRPFGQTSGNTR